MITKAFSIYDSKAQIYNAPFFMSTLPAALRSFGDLVNDSNTLVYRHPDDFTLYEIGDFNDETGQLNHYSENRPLGIASQFKTNGKVNDVQELMEVKNDNRVR